MRARAEFDQEIAGPRFIAARSDLREDFLIDRRPEPHRLIRSEPFGASILIEISLSPVLLFLLGVLLLGLALSLLAKSADSIARSNALFLLGLLWTMTMVGFHWEAARAQRELMRIFAGTATA